MLIIIALLFTISCQPPVKPHPQVVQTHEAVVKSREQLLSGDVEKKWWNVADNIETDKQRTAQNSNDVRFIFYRNYNVTTFGPYGTRQGHWSIDDDNDLSFHYEGPDSVRRFEIAQLDSNTLKLRNKVGDVYSYKPE